MRLENIDITIEKTERKKTVSIFIERDSSVRVLAPASASNETIETAIKSKEYLIFSKLAKWKELNQGKVNREYVNGQSFLYLGRNYRLKLTEDQNVPLKISGGFFLLDKKYLPKAEKVFKDFYKEKGLLKIKERIKVHEDKFSIKPTSVKVLDLQNRWASWTPKNGLNFHWKCVMAPVSVLDYIIMHEMVHLKYPNHSADFWNELDKKMPNFREQEKWLKRNGVKMSL
ncbi:MAG TPA: SprT family zinc-dependent metalloprotease [Bacteroidales bacterium]|nr:SprT family zinc-dependent metalloprotease [Bacteroidales bacterium]HOG67521.1 SprT family zinc-dependent metalloprotease [Bacteroidales bacterium]HPA12953.1 SprT family zinc-dependent metalloprotease [Bacteroidales bacterium]HQO08397.1 SprT family zinc-dependent metalloprotease [Bacteroidales bacterium]HQP53123.1 SprT family zinc-dependent metalloprotease [Bacteroidales bacterium]